MIWYDELHIVRAALCIFTCRMQSKVSDCSQAVSSDIREQDSSPDNVLQDRKAVSISVSNIWVSLS